MIDFDRHFLCFKTAMMNQSQISSPNLGIYEEINQTNEESREDLLTQILTVGEHTESSGSSSYSNSVDNGNNGSGGESNMNDGEITLEIILESLDASDETQWMKELVRKIATRFNRIPRGGWTKILNAFNEQFNQNKTLVEVKNIYNRTKSVTQRPNDNRQDHENLPMERLMTITNVQLFTKVKRTIIDNVDKYCEKSEMKQRTKKIARNRVNGSVN